MGNYLSDRRIELGLTQADVAKFVGVSESTISRWESGEIANMRRDRIYLLSQVLQTTPEFIMTGGVPAPGEDSARKQDILLSAVEEDIILSYRKAPAHIREAINIMLEPYWPSKAQEEAM